MDTIPLNAETVALYKQMLTQPEKFQQTYKPLKDCFAASETATAKHELFAQYSDYIKKPLPKVMFYIIMDELYPVGKASNGCSGYFLKLSI